jgi:DNA-3-methyladenine glycosylase II
LAVKQRHDPRAAARHLADADRRMGSLVERLGVLDDRGRRNRPRDPYGSLVRSIVGQQLSTKAAAAIFGRLTERFDGHVPTPKQVAAAKPAMLRAAGLSRAKVIYLKDLAARVADGRLDLNRISGLPDEDVTAELITVKGLGQWTADMFLIFHLDRPDVLPVGDLGIRRAVERLYGLKDLPGPDDLTKLAEPWRPYRSAASLYLWQSLDTPT